MYLFYITLSALLILFIYKIITRPYNYWKNRNIKFIKPKPLLGNMEIFNSMSFVEWSQKMYNQFPNDRYLGLYEFLRPGLMVRDPKLLKQFCVKEFDSFTDHLSFSSDIDPLWNKNLFQLKGDKWRKMRTTLSPAFTSSKMRSMFVLMETCAKQAVGYIKDQKETVYKTEIKDFFTRYTNDVIATCAFGLQCDSFKEQKNEFFLMGKKGTDFTGLRGLIFFVTAISATLMKVLRLKLIPSDVEKFFSGLIQKTLKLRREKGIVRQDMINLLLQAHKGKLKNDDNQELEIGFSTTNSTDSDLKKLNETYATISDEEITAQAFIFFLAGFDTTATLLTFTAYELAVNQDVQSKLIQEIDENCNRETTYETVLKLKYLDMVISETLRKWPPATVNDRLVTKDFVIEPELDGELPLLLEKGLVLWWPIHAIHRDPKYFPDPDKFDPERFSEENKHNIDSSTYTPFGMGPRICIGSRFALLEIKLLLVNILKTFEIVPIQKTKIPLVLNKNDLNLSCEGGMWLGFKQRN